MKLFSSCFSVNSSSENSVSIKTQTWSKDSFGLYDYESKHVLEKEYRTRTEQIIVREGPWVMALPPSEEGLIKSGAGLASLHVQNDKFFICGKYFEEKALSRYNYDNLWLAIRDVKKPGYRLSQGDVIRLGREVYWVRSISNQNQEQATLDEPVLQSQLRNGGINRQGLSSLLKTTKVRSATIEETQSSSQWRICFCNESTDDDPLISICQCRGSMEFIHLKWLRIWINSKLETREKQHWTSYKWKTLLCELWKTVLPSLIEVNGNRHEMVEIPNQEGGSMILETFPDPRTGSKTVHVVHLHNNAKVSLGRENDNDIKGTDISVSRNHAIIQITDGKAYLQDNKSKFGTLVRASQPIQLDSGNPLVLQNGRTLLTFEIIRPSSNWFGICAAPQNVEEMEEITYHERMIIGELSAIHDLTNAVIREGQQDDSSESDNESSSNYVDSQSSVSEIVHEEDFENNST